MPRLKNAVTGVTVSVSDADAETMTGGAWVSADAPAESEKKPAAKPAAGKAKSE
jgi:hypothetical protein